MSKKQEDVTPESVVRQAINAMKENGIYVGPNQTKMLLDKLSPALAQLDPEYLREYSEIIAAKIQQEVTSKSIVTSKMLGGLYIRESNLDKISSQLLEEHLDSSDRLQVEKINRMMYGLKSDEIETRLSALAVEKARVKNYDITEITKDILIEKRRENRELFDRIVLQGNSAPVKRVGKSPNKSPNDVIDNVIVKLKDRGVKLTPDQEKGLKAKLQEKLEPALSKLEPEYLGSNSDRIVGEIQKELYQDRSIGYRLGLTSFSVSDKSLDNVSRGIHSNHQQASDVIEKEIVKAGFEALLLSGTRADQEKSVLEENLIAFDVEQAVVKGIAFTQKEVSPEMLLKMRQENPELFDKVVLRAEKAAAQQVVSPPVQQVHPVQEVPVLVAPPPFLSDRHGQLDIIAQRKAVEAAVAMKAVEKEDKRLNSIAQQKIAEAEEAAKAAKAAVKGDEGLNSIAQQKIAEAAEAAKVAKAAEVENERLKLFEQQNAIEAEKAKKQGDEGIKRTTQIKAAESTKVAKAAEVENERLKLIAQQKAAEAEKAVKEAKAAEKRDKALDSTAQQKAAEAGVAIEAAEKGDERLKGIAQQKEKEVVMVEEVAKRRKPAPPKISEQLQPSPTPGHVQRATHRGSDKNDFYIR